MAGGESSGPAEYRALRADGGIIPVEVRTRPTLDPEGRPAGLVFAVRDISDRRRIQEELDRSENKFRIAFRTSPDAVCLNRLTDGLYLDISDGFTESTGYTWEDMRGKTSMELHIWDDPEERERLVRMLGTDGVVHSMEMSFRRKDGTVGTGLMSARVIDIGGELCILSITRDVSERKKMEAALEESEDGFRYVFEYSPIGKSITSPDGEIHVNRAFCRMLGYSQDELENKRWQDITPPEDVPLGQDALDSLLSGEGEEVRFEKRYLRKDGAIVWADVAIALRRDEGGAPRYFVVSITDITERKGIEASLRSALEESRRLEEERRLLSSTIEASLNEIYIFSADTLRFLFVNEGARRNLGYTEQECLQMTPVDIKPEFTQESFVAALEPLVAHQQQQLVFRTVHRRADGSLYPAEVHLQLYDHRPDPVFLAVIQDITEREEAEAALVVSEEKWRRILVNTPQIGVSLDREGRVKQHFL
jgi:PAS domain S-box-containing protein